MDDARTIHANLVLSQLEEHRAFGGVVPEIAARAHADHLHSLIRAALEDSGLALEDMDGFAATCGPGLIGGVMIGMVAAKALAAAGDKPFLAVNHLEGHALTARLSDNVRFPFLLLLVSGGHTQILVAENVGQYKPWGTTIDDAAGECFDKAARLMGLPYPGGPALQALRDGQISTILVYSTRSAQALKALIDHHGLHAYICAITLLSISAPVLDYLSQLSWAKRVHAQKPNKDSILQALRSIES